MEGSAAAGMRMTSSTELPGTESGKLKILLAKFNLGEQGTRVAPSSSLNSTETVHDALLGMLKGMPSASSFGIFPPLLVRGTSGEPRIGEKGLASALKKRAAPSAAPAPCDCWKSRGTGLARGPGGMSIGAT